MRKVIKRPDGSEEVVEGTAEEIAEYERRLKEGGKFPSTKKKPVIHGAPEVDGKPLSLAEVTLIRLSRAGLLPQEKVVKEKEYVPWPIMQPTPYWLQDPPTPISITGTTCRVCGQLNCNQLHIWCDTVWSDTALTCSAPTTSLQAAVDSALESFAGIDREPDMHGSRGWDRDDGMYPKH